MPSLHSWMATKFLHDDLVAHWGKPHYVWSDNGAKFVGSFALLCKGLGIINTTSLLAIAKLMGGLKDAIKHR